MKMLTGTIRLMVKNYRQVGCVAELVTLCGFLRMDVENP